MEMDIKMVGGDRYGDVDGDAGGDGVERDGDGEGEWRIREMIGWG